MITSLLAISEFATKLIGGLSGMIVAIIILILVIVKKNKDGD